MQGCVIALKLQKGCIKEVQCLHLKFLQWVNISAVKSNLKLKQNVLMLSQGTTDFLFGLIQLYSLLTNIEADPINAKNKWFCDSSLN